MSASDNVHQLAGVTTVRKEVASCFHASGGSAKNNSNTKEICWIGFIGFWRNLLEKLLLASTFTCHVKMEFLPLCRDPRTATEHC